MKTNKYYLQLYIENYATHLSISMYNIPFSSICEPETGNFTIKFNF